MKKSFLTPIGILLAFSLNCHNVRGVDASDFGKTMPHGNLGELLARQYTNGTVNELRMIILALCAFGLVAILFLIIGGIHYFSSHGDQERKRKATRTVKYALASLMIAFFAYALSVFIYSALP